MGRLVSVDDGVHMPTQRSFAALVGLTWRRHVTAGVEGRGSPNIDVSSMSKHFAWCTRIQANRSQLKGMIVEWEGIVAAVEEVKEGCIYFSRSSL